MSSLDLIPSLLIALASCGGSGGGNEPAEAPEGLEIFPAQPSLADETTLELVATAIYADGSTADVTDQVTWSSSDESVATIASGGSSPGALFGHRPGALTIQASLGGIVAAAQTNVSNAVLAGLELAPSTATAAAGTSFEALTIGSFSDDSAQNLTGSTTWFSSDTSVLTVSNDPGDKGSIQALGAGTATISATVLGQVVTTPMSVSPASLTSLEITPAAPELAVGTSVMPTATGVFSDGNRQDLTADVTWTSTNSSVASISIESGLPTVAAVGAGSASISASFSGVTATAPIAVAAATLTSLQIDVDELEVPAGATASFTATGLFSDGSRQDLTDQVTWTTSAGTVAAISNASGQQGVASALATGMATITATMHGGPEPTSASTTATVSAATLASLSIDPPVSSLAAGLTLPLTATGVFSDGGTRAQTEDVLWSSSDPLVAIVSNAPGREGLITAVAPGSATITAAASGSSTTATVSVTAATLTELALNPLAPAVPTGSSITLTATGTYTDGNTSDLTAEVLWSSLDPSVASISNSAGSEGRLSGNADGSTTIEAVLDGVDVSTAVIVVPVTLTTLTIDPALPELAAGTTLDLTATGTYSDATTRDLTQEVTWDSDQAGAASVSNAAGKEGRVSGIAAGSATITATLEGTVAEVEVDVNSAVLTSLSLSPESGTLAAGLATELTATGTFSDGSTQDLSGAVTWSSSSSSVASVSNAPASAGAVTALSEGGATITAALDGLSDDSDITVTTAELATIAADPSSVVIAIGSTLVLTATGTYTDASTADLTAAVTWSSDDAATASVSNAAGSEGVLTAVAIGSATVTATVDGISVDVPVQVTAATLLSISLSPNDAAVSQGAQQAFTATGTYSDASTQDLTELVTWSTTDEAIAVVSNAAGSRGVLTGLSFGLIFVNATKDDVTGKAFVIVIP